MSYPPASNPNDPGQSPWSSSPGAPASDPYGQSPAPSYGQQPQGDPYGAPQYGSTPAPSYGNQPGYGADASQYATPAYTPAPSFGAQGTGYDPYASAAPAPAKGLSIAGIIVGIFIPLVGLILSIVAFVKRKRAGASLGLPITGIIVSAVFLVIHGIITANIVSLAIQLAQACQILGPGVHVVDGITYTCG